MLILTDANATKSEPSNVLIGHSVGPVRLLEKVQSTKEKIVTKLHVVTMLFCVASYKNGVRISLIMI